MAGSAHGAASPRADGRAEHDPTLGVLVASFEEVMSARIRTGERIRALHQGRLGPTSARRYDVAPGDDAPSTAEDDDCDALLRRIARGEPCGASPSLGTLYFEQCRQEAALRRAFERALSAHPAWPWLSRVRGIGATLAAQLLSRLEIERAPHPSSLWAYCGLATAAAESASCVVCKARLTLVVDAAPPRWHRPPGGAPGARCTGALVPGGASARVAQPAYLAGRSRPYNVDAKRVCYLIGLSFTRQGGSYKAVYRAQWSRYAALRPDWHARRRYLAALRVTEKLFLAHLWTVWRAAVGLPLPTRALPIAGCDEALLDPWRMVDRETARRARTT